MLVRVTVRALQEADDLVHGSFEVLDHLLGRAVGVSLISSLPLLAGAAATAGPPALLAWRELPPAMRRELARDAGAAARGWLGGHPALVEHLVNGSGGLLDGLWDGLTPGLPGGPLGLPTFTPDTEAAAGTLAALYGDPGEVSVHGTCHDEVPPLVQEKGSRPPDAARCPSSKTTCVLGLGSITRFSYVRHHCLPHSHSCSPFSYRPASVGDGTPGLQAAPSPMGFSQHVRNRRSQFSPIILRTSSSVKPRSSRPAVMVG